jgi:hypothetical protein
MDGLGDPLVRNREQAEFNEWFVTNEVDEDRGSTEYAILDEPNLKGVPPADFAEEFARVAGRVHDHPDPRVAGARYGAPESTGFLTGPVVDGVPLTGADYLREILPIVDADLDQVTFHYWNHRDMVHTGWIRTNIEEAIDILATHDADGDPNEPILVTQLNVGSGASSTWYEHATHDGALWWAGIVLAAQSTGRCGGLFWFTATSDGPLNKGLMWDESRDWELKPVGYATRSLAQGLLDRVLETTGSTVELDALVTATDAAVEAAAGPASRSTCCSRTRPTGRSRSTRRSRCRRHLAGSACTAACTASPPATRTASSRPRRSSPRVLTPTCSALCRPAGSKPTSSSRSTRRPPLPTPAS